MEHRSGPPGRSSAEQLIQPVKDILFLPLGNELKLSSKCANANFTHAMQKSIENHVPSHSPCFPACLPFFALLGHVIHAVQRPQFVGNMVAPGLSGKDAPLSRPVQQMGFSPLWRPSLDSVFVTPGWVCWLGGSDSARTACPPASFPPKQPWVNEPGFVGGGCSLPVH